MVTLLASLLGFAGAAVPELLRLWREGRERVHELAVLDRQVQMHEAGGLAALQEVPTPLPVEVDRPAAEPLPPGSPGWVVALQASVRPALTYAFFAIFALVKLSAVAAMWTSSETPSAAALQQLWDEETQALWACVVSFWFGSRGLRRLRGSGS